MKQGTIARPKKSAEISISNPASLSSQEHNSGGYQVAELLPWLEKNKRKNKAIDHQEEQADEKSGLARLHALIKQSKNTRRANHLAAEQAIQAELAMQANQSLVFYTDELESDIQSGIDGSKADHSYEEVVQQLTIFDLNPPAIHIQLTKEEAAAAELDALYEELMFDTDAKKDLELEFHDDQQEKSRPALNSSGVEILKELLRTSGSGCSLSDEIELFEDIDLTPPKPAICYSRPVPPNLPRKSIEYSTPERTRANSTLNKLRKDEDDRVYTGCPESVEKMKHSSQTILRFTAQTNSTFELDIDEQKNEEPVLFYQFDEEDMKDTSPKLNRI